MLKQFTNCYVLRNGDFVREDLWVRSGKIVDPFRIFYEERIVADSVHDCGDALIVPGFIDLQINGGFGVDFSCDCGRDDYIVRVDRVAKGILEHGVTAFCPTLVTSSKQTYHTAIPQLKKTFDAMTAVATGSRVDKKAQILGVHLEGPFLSEEKKGAHDEIFIQSEFTNGFETLLDCYGGLERLANVSIITIAPELPNSQQVITELHNRNIIVSLGHSQADLNQALDAVRAGATFITHLFNAMPPLHHRKPGLAGLIASTEAADSIHFGIISDGVHVHPNIVNLAYRTNPNGLVLTTDAISAMGLRNGTHQIGTKEIEIRDNQAFIAKTNTLCGSIATMIECVRTFQAATKCSLARAIEAATLHPARVLGIEKHMGTLDFGSQADFVILSDDLNIRSTWIRGQCVYEYLKF